MIVIVIMVVMMIVFIDDSWLSYGDDIFNKMMILVIIKMMIDDNGRWWWCRWWWFISMSTSWQSLYLYIMASLYAYIMMYRLQVGWWGGRGIALHHERRILEICYWEVTDIHDSSSSPPASHIIIIVIITIHHHHCHIIIIIAVLGIRSIMWYMGMIPVSLMVETCMSPQVGSVVYIATFTNITTIILTIIIIHHHHHHSIGSECTQSISWCSSSGADSQSRHPTAICRWRCLLLPWWECWWWLSSWWCWWL